MGYVVGDTWYRPGSTVGNAMRSIEQNKRNQKFFRDYSGIGTNNIASAAAAAQAQAARDAANIQAAASDRVIAMQREQAAKSELVNKEAVKDAVAKVNPWRESGLTALGELTDKVMSGPGDYTQSPGYQFRLNEGQKAIERSAAARGNALSGAAVKAATRYGQNFATQDYDNFLHRYYNSLIPLQSLSGIGANTSQQQGNYIMQGANNISNSGQNTTNNVSQAAISSGNATANGIMNTANIIAAQQAAEAERNYAYNAWQNGEQF